MQVLLRRSRFRQDFQCVVCGQAFRLYWELSSPSERDTVRAIVLGELRDHHAREQGGDMSAAAHPVDLFRLPSWTSSRKLSRTTRHAETTAPHRPPAPVVLISDYAK
ncbi:hypothetical protein [Granulicella sp. L60]|uniref:hypothetical protein n=1 Tax=Granulicella sp. L60 TaxID=1641866 RepID=UPI00131CD1F9|nr:hypothetical protein [Granulicella sp. L60]